MNSSFLYHAWGLKSLECTREEYKGNTIILYVQSKLRQNECPKCGKRHLVKNGYRTRDFLGLPIGGKKIIIRMKVQRYKCKCCDYDQQEKIPFATGSCSYTHRFAKYVVDMLRSMTLKDVAARLDISRDTVKELENCPEAVHVFDHFHVVKLMNEKLDETRRLQYHTEKDINKRKVLKGTRYLLLSNGTDIFDKDYKNRLDNALAMNEPLSKAYYLKEQLREIWTQAYKEEAERVLMDWVEQAKESKIPQLQKMAMTLLAHKKGILAWYDCHMSTGKVEGINNKIKVMKRNAYGFRDENYFKLRLYALHDCRITRNVG